MASASTVRELLDWFCRHDAAAAAAAMASASTVLELLDWFCRHDAATSLSAAAAKALGRPPADGIDRISALPDDLLRDIVSRLPVCDAARTAALATRWRGLWCSAPLVLRDADLLASSSDQDAGAIAAVGHIFADHQGPFRAVKLTSFSLASRESELAEWSRALAAKGVQDLAIVDRSPLTNWGRRLPVDILRIISLRRLFLGFRAFPDTVPGINIAFPNLQELVTSACHMSDQDLEHVLACSPKLETLAIIFKIDVWPGRIRLRSQSLQCMILWFSMVEELAVLDAPCLKRLILRRTGNADESGHRQPMKIKIDFAPELRALGYLNPIIHQLQIGNTVINAETKVNPSSIVPSVNILALSVNFSDLDEVNMLCSFLRCFPNVDTLYIKSTKVGEVTGRHHPMFWEEIDPIECLKSHVRKIVIVEFQGEQSELDFLNFIAKRSRKLHLLQLTVTKETFASEEKMNELNCQLVETLSTFPWAAEDCKLSMLLGFEEEVAWNFRKSCDLSEENPFF